MVERKAVYIDYAQAIPMAFAIDQDTCLGCGLCENMCLADAIKYNDQPIEQDLNIGSIVLSTGTETYDPSGLDYLGYGKFPNVVTSAEFERILSASGPYFGQLMRPLDREEPQKIAWLQCVGSRDVNRCQNSHCSSVCCMYAIKESVIAKEHATDNLDCAIFYMDMRTYGKDFERYYNHAKEEEGVRFIRSRVHTINEMENGDLELSYFDENGELHSETFNMVVLSVGLQVSPKVKALADKLGIQLTSGNFCETSSFNPIATNREGIYVSGAFQGPKDIPNSVVDASAATATSGEILNQARHTQTEVKEVVPEKDVFGERPSIGVFVCKCGSNIAGVVDVPAVRDYAATLPYVDYADVNLYTCSQNTQDEMTEIIKEKNLNRVIVASCTPKTHEPLFKETLVNAGLNKYLFEMVNIRNQDSWVHKNNPDLATQKAKDLVRMAVTSIAYKEPLQEQELDIDQRAMVVGGGISGMSAALSLARQGHETHLIENSPVLGGQARNLYKTWKGEDIQANLKDIIEQVENHPNIQTHLESKISKAEGYVGNFVTTVQDDANKEQSIEHGVIVMATGAKEYQPNEYLYGQDSRVKTALELDNLLNEDQERIKSLNSAAFIQCVGSRDEDRPYCSRVCCTHSIQNALELKKINPDMNVFILYRDIRTYGEKESLYNEARNAGVIFVRYSLENKPQVTAQDDKLTINTFDPILQQHLEIETDLLTLASAIEPTNQEELVDFFKLPLNDDGFFAERHAKMGPSEFATDGMFLCGLAHYPKSIDESFAQGKAAASKAITLLSQEKILSTGETASINPGLCSSCGVCVTICPYSAPYFVEEGPNAGKAQINTSLCKGCGLCAASCRSGAITLKGSDMQQIYTMIEAI